MTNHSTSDEASAAVLLRLQVEQRSHDLAYHPDIVCLGTPRRITHLVLHLAKYAGALMESTDIQMSPGYRRNLVDAAIICLSGCTALSLNLALYARKNGADICLALPIVSKELGRISTNFQSDYVVEVAKLAKAAEAVDHQEEFPTRATWEAGFARLFFLVSHEAYRRDIDIAFAVPERLADVQRFARSLLAHPGV